MSEQKSVWVIEQGAYSDYRVVGVFTTKESADKMAALINEGESYDLAEVDEWPLDPGAEDLNQGRRTFSVQMLKDGTVEKAEPCGPSPLNLAGWVTQYTRSHWNPHSGVNAVVWAADEKHAVKIVNEHRVRIIAQGEWKDK
jgi:hypothetical protein